LLNVFHRKDHSTLIESQSPDCSIRLYQFFCDLYLVHFDDLLDFHSVC